MPKESREDFWNRYCDGIVIAGLFLAIVLAFVVLPVYLYVLPKYYDIPQNNYNIKVYSPTGSLVSERVSSDISANNKTGIVVNGEEVAKSSNIAAKTSFVSAEKAAEEKKKTTDTVICFTGEGNGSGNSTLTIYTPLNEKIAVYTGDIQRTYIKRDNKFVYNTSQFDCFEINGNEMYVYNGTCVLENGVQ